MKYVKLIGSAYVNGVLRHPHEGALHLSDEEAKRLVDGKLADDVTADFDDVDGAAEAPAERITTEDAKAPRRASSKES